MAFLRSVAAWLGVGVLLCGCTLACGPSAATPPSPTAAESDPFAVVRATSQAAYASGRAHLDRGEYLQACVDLDAARTSDPDNRTEINQALAQALQYCLTPAAEATSAPAQGRPTLVVATVAAARATLLTQAAAPATLLTQAAAPATLLAQAAARPTSTTAPAEEAPAGGEMVNWKDPQGRFAVSQPADWVRIDQPASLFGTPVVAFSDPSGRAELDVAVDANTKAVSPELYAASMEIAMRQQVPGYASEQVQPGATAGSPSVRRVFTFMQHDASGQDHQARGFQVTLVKGSTPYIISGSAPADQFQQFSPTFDQIVDSFRFS